MSTGPAVDASKGKHRDEIWKDDFLDRKADADFLQKFLIARLEERRTAGIRDSYVLNINAAWGEGKTFFLQRFARSLEQSGHLVASVNAWADDHADDPLLPVMAAVDAVVRQGNKVKETTRNFALELGKMTGQVVVATAKGAATQYLGDATEEIGQIIGKDTAGATAGKVVDQKGEALLARFQQGKESIARFKELCAEVGDGMKG